MKKLLFCLFLIYQTSSWAFTLSSSSNSSMKGWDTKTLTFHLNPQNCPSDIRSLIEDAMDLWNSVSSSHLTLELGSDTSVTPAQAIAGTAADTPAIVCDASFGTTFSSADPDYVAGVGFNSTGSGNNIVYGALALNYQSGAQASLANFDAMSAKIVIAHELGHVLGLGHSEDSSSLMYYDIGSKTNLSFSEDDYNGIIYLYGRDEWMMKDPLAGGCGIIAAMKNKGAPPSNSSKLPIFLTLLPLFVLFYFYGAQKNKNSSVV